MPENATPPAVTISMVMIAKDEASNVRTCFDSFWADVDEVVFVDTGSTDGTMDIAEAYAAEKGEPDKLVVGRFTWNDDFAAARNYADSLATSEWTSWIDLDDVAVGVDELRKMAAQADPGLVMLYARYDYAFDERGHCFCELWRERLSRRGYTQWLGRVHECQVGQGTMMRVDPAKVRWEHRRTILGGVRDRNEKLLRAWVEDDPGDARAVSYLAFELMGSRVERENNGESISEPDHAKIAESIPYFQQYLSMPNQSPEMRAQMTRRYAQVLLSMGHLDEALNVSMPMLVECPSWPDTMITIAEVAHEKQQWQQAIHFATQVLQAGQPDTMLIVNPEDYTLRPRVLIASGMAALGKLEEAVQTAQQIVDVNPGYMGMAAKMAEWAAALARDQAGNTWANNARLLIQNDEPEKALLLLQTVPYFSSEHPAVVAARVLAANALSEPYQLEAVGDSPRGQFLARCLREQTESRELEAAAA